VEHEAALVAGAGCELPEQARLAHARIALESREPRLAFLGVREPAQEQVQLAFSPYEA
jgi:hypothetical protein